MIQDNDTLAVLAHNTGEYPFRGIGRHGTPTITMNQSSFLKFLLLASAIPYSTGFNWMDDLVRARLENTRATEFRWLLWATGFVVIGVILEESDLILKICRVNTERLRVFRSGTIVVTQFEILPWIKRLSRFGWIVLVVGLIGELRIEPDISDIDKNIGYLSESHIEIARTEAAQANERAGAAYERAASLEKDAEHERLLRIQLEWKVAWRRLSDKDKAIMADDLRPVPTNVLLSYANFDAEMVSFATDIALALKAAQWNVSPPAVAASSAIPGFGNPIQPIAIGIAVSSTSRGSSTTAGKALCHELSNRFGFDTSCDGLGKRKDPNPFADGVWVAVGGRPEGPQGEAKLREGKKTKKSAKP